jgi:serine/threonine protein kinase
LSGIFVIDYNEIELGQVLGKGGFGIVYLGNWAGQEVAVKMLKSDGDIQLTKDQIQEFQDEASLMMSIPGHINVCQFLGICTEPLVILTELCSNGSVHEYIKKNGDLDRQTVMHIVKGVASGMSHLHGQGIVHRDLAARNVLLNSSFDAKISDFGLSRVIDKTREGEDNDGVGQTKTEVGPLKWMAPECLRYLQYSQKTDVWAFSCTMYEIICGCEPYAGMGAVQVATGVSQGELQLELPADKLPHWPEIKELMALCMTFEPSTRPDFQTIVSYMANWAP